MPSDSRIHHPPSLATQLVKKTFGLYCIVAVSVTLIEFFFSNISWVLATVVTVGVAIQAGALWVILRQTSQSLLGRSFENVTKMTASIGEEKWDASHFLTGPQSSELHAVSKNLEGIHESFQSIRQTHISCEESLERASHRLKFLLSCTRDIAASHDKFTAMMRTTQAICGIVPLPYPMTLHIYFHETPNLRVEGFTYFQLPLEKLPEKNPLLMLPNQFKIFHSFSYSLPASIKTNATTGKQSGGCFFQDRRLVVPMWRNRQLQGVLELEGLEKAPQLHLEDRNFIDTLSQFVALTLEDIETTIALEKRVIQRTEQIRSTLRQLRNAQAQLVQTSKLASLGEMATGIAHELNQPLFTIRMCARNLIKDIEADFWEDVEPSLKKVVKQVDRSSQIIKHLRTFGRDTQDAPTEEVDLNDIIHESFMLFGEQLKSREIQIHLELTEGLPSIHCLPIQIEQVLINLLGNARDALDDQEHKEIWMRSYLKEEWVVTEVQDSGKGIPKDDLERIFDPFFTTKEVGKGTGLGLSISYGIIRNHGGELKVLSTGKEGTCFAMYLPTDL